MGVNKDDFQLLSESQWPLIEYENGTIKSTYLNSYGTLRPEFSFQGSTNEIKPFTSPYFPVQGLSSCFYYQQEFGADGKPMKNKACVMLALGLEDSNKNKYMGVLNFAAAGSGRLSQITTDRVNMPDINVQALDQNKYRDWNELKGVEWQHPQKMNLLDIDPNGLSTSGGVLKFSYTSSNVGTSQGYSDAVEATAPYLFDDLLGRVNLYFKGKNKNFFVLYFNPTGSKKVEITDTAKKVALPALSLKPRLDRDMVLEVQATVPANGNYCSLTIKSKGNLVEEWTFLPRRYSQIASILNGESDLPLGTLEPLGKAGDLRAGYLKQKNPIINLRTTVDNNLFFSTDRTFVDEISRVLFIPIHSKMFLHTLLIILQLRLLVSNFK